MNIHQQKHRLQVTDSDLSGSVYDDVNLSGSSYENVNMSGGTFDDLNMSGWRVHHVNLSGLKIDRANLAGASIVNSRLDGMTIDGIEVTELMAAWKAKNAARHGSTGTSNDALRSALAHAGVLGAARYGCRHRPRRRVASMAAVEMT